MHVSSYDTNTGDWRHHEFSTANPIGPAAALDWLCDDNKRNQDDGPPCGPLRYHGDTDRFVLVAAWTLGRQWFEVVAIFSAAKLPDEELEAILDAEDVGEEDDEEYELTVEVVRDFNTFYGLLSIKDIRAIMDEKDLAKRDKMVLDRTKPTTVGGDDECDLSIVIDDQPAEQRWGDHEEDWLDAIEDE